MSSVKSKKDIWFPALFDELLNPDWLGGTENVKPHTPAVNILESDKAFVLELVAPGRKKEGFNIEVNENILTISS